MMKNSIKQIVILLIFQLLISSMIGYSQTYPKEKLIQLKEIPEFKGHITKEIEEKIDEVVKPVRETIEKLYKEDNSGNFKSYVEEIKKVSELTDDNEKYSQLKNIQKKYYPFVKHIWNLAKIDDEEYQEKLKNIFPEELRETIKFSEFLNFTMGGSNSQKPAPPPAPAPSPKNICVNANTLFSGAKNLVGGAVGGAKAIIAPARPPSPAEVVLGADAAIIGDYRVEGWLLNTISIPGNFPDDKKVLRSKKTFDWYASGCAFSVFGGSFSTVAYSTDAHSDDFNVNGEIYTVVSPVTFLQFINKKISKTEEIIISKNDLKSINFGIMCYARATSTIFLSYANAVSSSAMLKWEICEE